MEPETPTSSAPNSRELPANPGELPLRYFPWVPVLLAVPLVLVTFAIFASFAPPS